MKLTKRRARKIRSEILLAREHAKAAGYDPNYVEMYWWDLSAPYEEEAYKRTYKKEMDKYIASLPQEERRDAENYYKFSRLTKTQREIVLLGGQLDIVKLRVTRLEKKLGINE